MLVARALELLELQELSGCEVYFASMHAKRHQEQPLGVCQSQPHPEFCGEVWIHRANPPWVGKEVRPKITEILM
jgi:hypothetical protein